MYANKLNNKNTDHKNKFIIPIDKFRYEMDTSLKSIMNAYTIETP